MELNFDIRGNLKADKIIKISLETFENSFVNAFEDNSIRKDLFICYENYLKDLSKLMSWDFYQWIDGSYISSKSKPKDIDILTIVDYRDYEVNKKLLEQNFASFSGRKKYKVDAYIIAKYPQNHKKYIFTQSDLAYWSNLFGKTRVNRAKRQYKKGFIQLNFRQNG